MCDRTRCGSDGTALREWTSGLERNSRPTASADCDLRTDAGWKVEADWSRLPGDRVPMGRKSFRTTRAYGTALPLLRSSQPLRTAGVLHAACLGVEGEPERRVCELASECLVPVILRSVVDCGHVNIQPGSRIATRT